MSDAILSAWRHPSAILLFVQMGGVLAYPFMEKEAVGRAAFQVFGLIVLVLALRAVRSTPALTWVALLLGTPVVLLTIAEGLFPENETLVLVSSTLHGAFYFYTAYALLRYILHDSHISTDELWAIGAAFTVVAWAFAYVFVAVQVIWPGSFTVYGESRDPRSWMELLFLSFTTLTSTGLSDVIPVRPNARSVVMIEQVAGLMYVAFVVSRAVGLTVNRQHRDRQHEQEAEAD